MTKKISVTIGIPAHNEENNIYNLIDSLLKQETKVVSIEEIIVILSGEYVDETSVELKEKYGEKITVIADEERTSKIDKINRVFRISKSDLITIIDGDIIIKNVDLIENISIPFLENKNILLTTPKIEPLYTKNLLQKILNLSIETKYLVSEQWNNGDNYLKSNGRCLTYRKQFITNNPLPDVLGEDFYIYVKAKEENGVIKEVSESKIFYKLPNTMLDHIKQSSRFFYNKKSFTDSFAKDVIEEYGTIPLKLNIIILKSMLRDNVLYTFLYFCLLILSKTYSIFIQTSNSKWNISKSTK